MAEPLDEAAARLYALPLEDFTRTRDALARELRKAKQRELAAEVGRLPKPTQAAWAANTLARDRRDLVDALLAAGEALREAQEEAVAGRGARALRDATAAERAAVDALVAAARDLEPGGRRPTAATLDRLRTTLHAAAADEAVRTALAEGRLAHDPEAGGGAWGLFATEPPPAKRTRKREAAKPAAGKREASEAVDREAQASKAVDREAEASDAVDREVEARAAAAREAEERERAEREAAERERRARLEAELREARAERRARERELARAEREAERAAARLEAALAAAQDAREHAEEARGDLDAAREAAEAARDHAARLEEQLD